MNLTKDVKSHNAGDKTAYFEVCVTFHANYWIGLKRHCREQ